MNVDEKDEGESRVGAMKAICGIRVCYCGASDRGGNRELSGERGAISSSHLLDCDELRDAESISLVSYPVEEIRWEDEIVETILSGRCCERSCFGPSVSLRSVTFSNEERNAADSWSSCASYNPGDCDSLSDSLVINFPVKELDVEAEVLQCEEPKSPPLQYVQKHIVEPESFVLDEAAEQPSPVSVLQSPFHDETCTSESSPDSKRDMGVALQHIGP